MSDPDNPEPIVVLLSPISSASRTVWILIEEARANSSCSKLLESLKMIEVNMLRAEHLQTPEYSVINPSKTVPTLVHGKIVLSELRPILQYLVEIFELPQTWWPCKRDIRLRSRIVQYISWNSVHIRAPIEELLSHNIYQPIEQKSLLSKSTDSANGDDMDQIQERVTKSLAQLDSCLAKTPYLAGNEISIADICIATELAALEMLSFDFTTYPNLWRWLEVLAARPTWKTTHKFYNEVFIPAIKSAFRSA